MNVWNLKLKTQYHLYYHSKPEIPRYKSNKFYINIMSKLYRRKTLIKKIKEYFNKWREHFV